MDLPQSLIIAIETSIHPWALFGIKLLTIDVNNLSGFQFYKEIQVCC